MDDLMENEYKLNQLPKYRRRIEHYMALLGENNSHNHGIGQSL